MSARTMLDPVDDNDGSLLDTVADWPVDQLADFLRRTIDVLNAYSAAPMGSQEQRAIIVEAVTELAPLHFALRSEPCTSVANELRALAAADPERWTNVLTEMLRRRPDFLDADQLETLLTLLVEINAAQDDMIAFFAVESMERIAPPGRAQRIAGLLPGLLVGSGPAAISLLERIEAGGLLDMPALFASLQQVAQYDPGRFGELLTLYQSQFDDAWMEEAEADGVIPFLLRDLVGRAGFVTVLDAIFECEPQAAPALFAAAFSGPAPLFKVVRKVESNNEDRLWVQFGGKEFSLSAKIEQKRDEEWFIRFLVLAKPTIHSGFEGEPDRMSWRAAVILGQPVLQVEHA